MLRLNSRIAVQMSRAITEVLESRRLMCADHVLESVETAVINHDESWYQPYDVVTLSQPLSAPQLAPASGFTPVDPIDSAIYSSAYPSSYTVNAAGLPLLTSRTDGGGLKVFLDFDGYNSDLPFDLDGANTTFNAAEQKAIVETWRDIVSYFSPLDVNVTTVQPATGGSNPVFVWQRITNSVSGGAAYVGWLTNNSSQGWTGPENATGRHSGIAHEIGHQLGLNHQSEWNKYGDKTAEYTDGFGNRDRPVIGIDYANVVRGWFYGRDAISAGNLVDDLGVMSNIIKVRVGGDGYLPDDYAGTLGGATPVPASGMLEGVIERNSDVDTFSLNVTTAGTYLIDTTPLFESAVSNKIELLDASGNIIASRDDADQRDWNNNDQEFNINLAAGNYYVRVLSSGDYGEQGEYLLTAAPLPSGWASQDVGNTSIYRAGTASFNATTNTLRQLGGGSDIWTTADQFRFTSQVLTGNGSITARVDSIDNVDVYAKAGVMIRQTLANNSPHVYFGIKPSGELETIQRTTAGASSSNITNTAGQVGPWIRLTRAGNVFTLSKSVDGSTWTTVTTTTISMTSSVYIGFATNSRNTRQGTWATYSNIAVTGTLGTTAAAPNALDVPTGLTATPAGGVNTSIVLNWTDTPLEAGYAIDRSVDGVTYTQLATVGANVTTYTDTNPYGSMRYYYRVVARDASATRSVPSSAVSVVNKPNTPTNPNSSYAAPFISPSTTQIYLNWADVQGDEGYKVERSSNGGSTYTLITTTTKNYNAYNDGGLVAGTAYTYRITPVTSVGDGATGSLTINAATRVAAPTLTFTAKNSTSMSLQWTDVSGEAGYRLEKSIDGTVWSTLTSLGANVTTYIDSAVTAVNEYYYRIVGTAALIDGMTSTAIFAGSPGAALPTGWTRADIGSVSGTGAASNSGTSWKVISAGNDIAGSADTFGFVYKPMTANSTIIAKIDSLENTSDAAKAGIMIRQDLTAGSKFAAIMINAGSTFGIDVRSRATANTQYTYQQALPSVLAPYWLKLVRTGSTITTFYSVDGTTFTSAATINLSTTGTFYLGIASTAANSTLLNTANFSNVFVSLPPTVASAATANPNPVTGTTTNLSVLGADDNDEANLKYSWAATGSPPAPVTFSVNGTNAAKNTVATFTQPGTYNFVVTITDPTGYSVTSSVAVTVPSTSSIAGQVYEDRNSNGVLDLGEPTQIGVTIFLDSDSDGILDAGEFSTVTSGAGNYTFSNVSPGNYTIRQITPAGYFPIITPGTVNVTAGGSFNGNDFANFPSVISGTVNAENYVVRKSGIITEILVNNVLTYSIASEALPSLAFNAGDGSDSLLIDYATGNPVPAGTIGFDGNAGIDTFAIQGAGLSDNFSINTPGVVTHGSFGSTYAGAETVNVSGGNYAIGVDLGAINLQVVAAQVSFSQTQQLATLSVSAGANVFSSSSNALAPAMVIGGVTIDNATLAIALNGGLAGVSKFGSLSISGTGKLELHNNDLVIDYGANASVYADLVSRIGTSIVSQEVANQTPTGAVLAIVDNASANVPSVSGGYSSYSNNSVLIKYTWLGDANFDGVVDGTDYALADSGFAGGGSAWNAGDFNLSGMVDGTDYAYLDTGFGSQSGNLN